MNEFFSPMILEKIETDVTPITIFSEIVGENCKSWFNIARIHPWLKKRFLKFPNAQKPIIYTRMEARKINDKALEKIGTMNCTNFHNATHNTMACYNIEIDFSKFQNVKDLLLANQIWSMPSAETFQTSHIIPSNENLQLIIEKILNNAQFFVNFFPSFKVPRETIYSEIPAHCPGWYAIGTNKVALIRGTFGYDIKRNMGSYDNIPQIHITQAQPSEEDINSTWTHVLKMLKNNRIFRVEKKHIQFLIPNFLIHQLQSDGSIKTRFILDCSYISAFFKPAAFSLTSPETACALVKGRYVICVDFSKAFFQIQTLHKNVFFSVSPLGVQKEIL